MQSRLTCSAIVALAGLALHTAAIAVATSPQTVASAFGQLPLAFEENHGQAPADTRFIARGPGYQVHVSSAAVAMALVGHDPHGTSETPSILRLRLIGARDDVQGSGIERLAGTTNYFLGSEATQQFVDVPNFARVRFDEIYPGIGIVYYGNQRNLEYDIVLQPGADPANIRLALDGADQVTVDSQGNLSLSVGAETMLLKLPAVYQEYDGQRHAIAASFKRLANNEIGIRTANYDRGHALTIDPTLVYSTYLGGSSRDLSNAIAVDSSGNAYITGTTYSTDFPIVSAYQTTPGKRAGYVQAFVTKFNTSGTALVYSTYLGDKQASNAGNAIAVDASGNAYVTGTTNGTAFPTTTGAYQATNATAGNNSFIAKLGPAGNSLMYGTYLLNATAKAIVIDGTGDAFVTGTAIPAFKTSTGAYQTAAKNPSSSPFVFKLNPQGATALYATFLGGNSYIDTANSVAVDGSGNAYVGGCVLSADFPMLNAYQSTPGGGCDAYITKFNPQGSGLIYSTRLGGSNYEEIFGITVDSAGSVYATGKTESFDYPVTANAFQKALGGASNGFYGLPNAFVTKLAPAGSSLIYSSYLGGNGAATSGSTYGDWGTSIALDSAGHAFITGEISSTTGFPLTGDLLPGMPESTQGMFVAKISAFGDAVLYGTHIGWKSDWSYAIAVDSKGDAYATATANAGGDIGGDSFLISSGAYQKTPNGTTWEDAIVTKLSTGPAPLPTLSLSATSVDSGQPITANISVGYGPGGSGTPTGSVLVYDGSKFLTSLTLSNGTAATNLTLPVGVHSLAAVYRNSGAEGVSPTQYVAVNQPATCN